VSNGGNLDEWKGNIWTRSQEVIKFQLEESEREKEGAFFTKRLLAPCSISLGLPGKH
jgi:hypothetical protein